MKKFQITEEQFEVLYKECGYGMIDSQDYKDWKRNMKQMGYICKSELEQLIEEAEELYKNKEIHLNNNSYAENYLKNVCDKLYKALQAVKESK